MIGEQFWSQVIIVLGSVLTTYITVKHGPKITNYLRGSSNEAPAADSYKNMFDGYERSLDWYRRQDELKNDKIDKLEKINEHIQLELNKSRRIIAELKEDNIEKEKTIAKLQHSVTAMRKKYDPGWENSNA